MRQQEGSWVHQEEDSLVQQKGILAHRGEGKQSQWVEGNLLHQVAGTPYPTRCYNANGNYDRYVWLSDKC